MEGLFIENFQVLGAISPSADIFNGDPDSDVFSMKNLEKIVFLVAQKSGGTNTGTATLRVRSATSPVSSPAGTAITFTHSKKTTGLSDTMGAPTKAVAANGIVTTANEDTIHVIEVDAKDLPDGHSYVYLDTTETVNDPVLGAVVALGVKAKLGYPFPTALT